MEYISQKTNEPLIIEREDWTSAEWETLLKLFGLRDADRIVISDYKFEAWGEWGNEREASDMPANYLKDWAIVVINDKMRVRGQIYNDRKMRFTNGTVITTSPIVELDVLNGKLETLNGTVYKLQTQK